MSSLAQLRNEISAIASSTKQTSQSLASFRSTLTGQTQRVQAAIGSSAQRKDQEVVAALQDAQRKVDAAARSLQDAARIAENYGRSL